MLTLDLSKQAEDFLTKLNKGNKNFAILIAKKIKDLLENPTPSDCKKLTNKPYYRIRAGSFRIIYNFNKDILFVIIIDKRDRVYKNI